MTTIKDAFDDLFNNKRLPADEAVDRHYGPAFRQCVNGTWDDRAAFLARVIQIRQVIKYATITVLEELTEGGHYAERHIIDLVQHDGTRIRQEVFAFADRDSDGRFTRIEEMTLTLQGDPGPASARQP